MSALAHPQFLSVEDYLAGETLSEVRHEYVAGEVFAMAGASKTHGRLTLRLGSLLDQALSSSNCAPFVSDMKVRLRLGLQDVFYYPDVVVTCDPADGDSHFLRFPKLIIEVLSPATERVDRREKLQAYITIPSLEEYVLVSQERFQIIIYRRRNDWAGQSLTALEDVLELESLNLKFTLGQIYENISVNASGEASA